MLPYTLNDYSLSKLKREIVELVTQKVNVDDDELIDNFDLDVDELLRKYFDINYETN